MDGRSGCIRRGVSRSRDPAQAAGELLDQLDQPNISLILIFCSADYDLPALSAALTALCGSVAVVGCTTAGEITPAGYLQGAIVGVSLAAPDFVGVAERIEDLSQFNITSGHDLVQRGLRRLHHLAPHLGRKDVFALLLIDGLSVCEEAVVSSLHSVLGEIPLFGGSAADPFRFDRTYVLHDGTFHRNSAVVILIATHHPFRVFKTEHFVSSDKKMVVTEADPARRIVTEINGEPAALEYAGILGLDVDQLTPMVFAAFPVVVKVGGMIFVRSIQKVNADHSLTFFCAIDEGIVLTVAKGVDMVENLTHLFEDIRRDLGPPQLILGCDCILRTLEQEQKGLSRQISDMMAAHNVIGFNTFGEQFQAMHVNQTFTGVAIGGPV